MIMLIDPALRHRWQNLPPNLQTRLAACQLLLFDFDGVFTDNTVYTDSDGNEMVRCNRSDTFGLPELRAAGVDVVIISTETNSVVSKRAEKLNIACHSGLGLDKSAAVRQEMETRHLVPEQVIYVGNDVNDHTCFEIVGTTIAVADAFPPTRDLADYVTTAHGGNGAVREVLALLLLAKQL